MKKTLFKILFPKQYAYQQTIETENAELKHLYEVTTKELLDERGTFAKEPNMADMMRDNVGSINIPFTTDKVDEGGNWHFPDYLEGLNDDEYKIKLANAETIWNNPMFHEIHKYLVDLQGNFTVKRAKNDMEIYAGRFNINGFNLFKKELERCHAIFSEINAPPEEYDAHEVV